MDGSLKVVSHDDDRLISCHDDDRLISLMKKTLDAQHILTKCVALKLTAPWVSAGEVSYGASWRVCR